METRQFLIRVTHHQMYRDQASLNRSSKNNPIRMAVTVMIVVGTQAPPNRHPPKVTGSSRQYFRWCWFRRLSSSSFSLSSSSSLKCVNLPSFVRTAGSRPNTVFRAAQHHHRHTRGGTNNNNKQ
uniref:(northern house mosquito) hypothetical protein n=1 Tax=Culex pipiens TaxID=7175 RepID=A0A8D8EYA6_CULPI